MKYPGFNHLEIQHEFHVLWEELNSELDEQSIIKRLRLIHSVYDDIANQVAVLVLIEAFWSRSQSLVNPLTILNSFALGEPGEGRIRVTSTVGDYDGVIDVPVPEIRSRLDELERLVSAGVSLLKGAGIIEQAFFLAYVHASLIRIHPFADGNGRTARFFVQYAMRSWHMPPLPLPKVRNDPLWKSALTRAISGDYMSLRDNVASRMREVLVAQEMDGH